MWYRPLVTRRIWWNGLAYEAIFKRTVSELIPGLYQKVEQEVATRAKTLAGKMDNRKPNRQTARKREVFADLAALQS